MEGAPVRNENSHTTVPDNIAWLHYYTPSEDWLITRRFFDIRDRKVFCKPMFYAATTGRRLHSALHENLWVYSGGIGRSPKA